MNYTQTHIHMVTNSINNRTDHRNMDFPLE